MHPQDITTLAADAIVNAARIAVDTVRDVITGTGDFDEIVFCCFSEADKASYKALLRAHTDEERE